MFSPACLQGKGFDLRNRRFFNEIVSPLKVATSSVTSSGTRTQIMKNLTWCIWICIWMHIKHKFVKRNPNRFSCSNNVMEWREFNTILCLQFSASLTYMPMICCFFKMRIWFRRSGFSFEGKWTGATQASSHISALGNIWVIRSVITKP